MTDVIEWCNICNAAPSDGKLTVLDENNNQLVLDACTACVAQIPKGQWL